MGDLNLDGSLDIVQANGMVDDSADKKFPERQDYWYRASQVMRAGPEVHSYADRWADLRGYDIWGHQQNRVYLSNGAKSAQFRDVADLVGLTEKTNSRAVGLVTWTMMGIWTSSLRINSQAWRCCRIPLRKRIPNTGLDFS